MKCKRQADLVGWEKNPDFKGSAKTIGRYRVELLGGTDRGAEIHIWEPGYESLEHIWPPSDDRKWHKTSTINFWYFSNAKEEYQRLSTIRTIFNLLWRNM